jgi:LPXTG-motif cell wall-anchored protein
LTKAAAAGLAVALGFAGPAVVTSDAAHAATREGFVVARHLAGAGDLGPEILYRVNLSTGKATRIGSLGLPASENVGSLALAPNGTLYAVEDTPPDGPPTPASLYTINTATGKARLVGSLRSAQIVSGLAFARNGKLYYSAATLPVGGGVVGNFGTIDTATGTATVINPADPQFISVGLAGARDGTMFGISLRYPPPPGERLRWDLTRITATTGRTSVVGPTGLSTNGDTNLITSAAPDIAFNHATGILYGILTDVDNTGTAINGVRLQTINKTTGAASTRATVTVAGDPLIAAVDAITIDPITSPSPTPSGNGGGNGPMLPATGAKTAGLTLAGAALILLGVVVVAASRRRRRTPAGR